MGLFKRINGKVAIYVILRLLVVVTLVRQFLLGDYYNVLTCVLTLVLFMIPLFVERRLNIELPSAMEIIILLFIFSAEVMGEINEYYVRVPGWDTMLHIINGFVMGAIGFSLIDILNRSEKVHMSMSPVFLALTAFCFSMTVGVLWEFFEFFADVLLKTDMQKDCYIGTISSVLLNPQGRNSVVTVDVQSVVVNGQQWAGYIDIGLFDTMKDLLVNCAGATLFSVIGVFFVKYRGGRWLMKSFIPRMKTPQKIQEERAAHARRRQKPGAGGAGESGTQPVPQEDGGGRV